MAYTISTSIMFDCDPNKVARLQKAALAVVREMRAGRVSADIVAKLKETRRRQLETRMKSNVNPDLGDVEFNRAGDWIGRAQVLGHVDHREGRSAQPHCHRVGYRG